VLWIQIYLEGVLRIKWYKIASINGAQWYKYQYLDVLKLFLEGWIIWLGSEQNLKVGTCIAKPAIQIRSH
jgi:hypothetical protein